MAAIDDLNSAVAAIGTSVSAEISAATTAITNALASGDSTAIEAAVTTLNATKTTLDNFTASLTPAPPAPPSVP